jgi:hypothetical protein
MVLIKLFNLSSSNVILLISTCDEASSRRRLRLREPWKLMELRGSRPMCQRFPGRRPVLPYLALDSLFGPANLQEASEGEIRRVAETWCPENINLRQTLH